MPSKPSWMLILKGNKCGWGGMKGFKLPTSQVKVQCITTDFGRLVNSYGLPQIMYYVDLE